MASKKEYINLIRWSCIIDSFTRFYFIRIIVMYLLSQNVESWVAVSIPIVLEFSELISRGFKLIVEFAVKVDYKRFYIFYLITFMCIGLVISQCKSVYTIYFFTSILGFLSGIKNSSKTKLNTQNKSYEPYCFIEEERAKVVGGTLGLLASQFIYDISSKLYLLGYVVLIILGTVLNISLKRVPNEDVMETIDENKALNKKEKKSAIITTSLFGVLAGLWCMGWGGFEEIVPLISNKVGYLNAISTALEIVLLFIISGSVLDKIKKRKKLLFNEMIIACLDVSCLLIAAITLSWKGLLIGYIITGFSSTMGDPIWGSILSAYSTNNRQKWVLINRIYFIIRAIFSLLTILICRECVIRGVESFRYLAIILIGLIIVVFGIANAINKKIFGHSI